MDRIGVGLVGLSASRGWAATAHLPALRAQPENFEVRASCGSSPESGAAGAKKHGVPVACADPEELAARADVDLVVVTVKVPEHERLVALALAEGKAVLCEWPLGNGIAEAERMTAQAHEYEVPAFVGLQARSAPAVRHVRELVSEGVIGELLSTSVIGSGGQWGATTDDLSAYLLDDSNGATLMTIPFGHTLDGVCFALGEISQISANSATRRTTVTSKSNGEQVPMTAADQIAVTGVLESGAIASFHYRGGRSAGTNFRWEIYGTRGDIVVAGDIGHLQYGNVEVLVSKDGGALKPSSPPARCARIEENPNSLSYTVAQAYAAQAQDLRHGGHRAPRFTDALRRHQTLDDIRLSANRTTGVSTP